MTGGDADFLNRRQHWIGLHEPGHTMGWTRTPPECPSNPLRMGRRAQTVCAAELSRDVMLVDILLPLSEAELNRNRVLHRVDACVTSRFCKARQTDSSHAPDIREQLLALFPGRADNRSLPRHLPGDSSLRRKAARAMSRA